jgi:hypothetical protein
MGEMTLGRLMFINTYLYLHNSIFTVTFFGKYFIYSLIMIFTKALNMSKVTSVLATLVLVLSGCNAENPLSNSIFRNETRSSKVATFQFIVMPDQECPPTHNDLPFISEQIVHPSAKLCFY